MSVFYTEDKEWNSSNSSRSKNFPICSNYHLFKSYTSMRCRFNCHIYYTIYIIFTEFFKLNVWYYNVTHLYEVDYRLLCHISSFLYEIFMELFLSRQNDQIAPVLDTCGWRCSVTPLRDGFSKKRNRVQHLRRLKHDALLSSDVPLSFATFLIILNFLYYMGIEHNEFWVKHWI